MKEDLKDMMKHFNWERFIVGIVAAVAVAAILLAIIMPLATNNGWYVLLLIVPVLCTGFILGVNE